MGTIAPASDGIDPFEVTVDEHLGGPDKSVVKSHNDPGIDTKPAKGTDALSLVSDTGKSEN